MSYYKTVELQGYEAGTVLYGISFRNPRIQDEPFVWVCKDANVLQIRLNQLKEMDHLKDVKQIPIHLKMD